MNPLLAFIFIASLSEVVSDHKVVVLSFAGFRADYYSLEKTPKLWNLRSESAAPDHLVSIFPTKTMVALHSVSTGVYPNVHGLYGNEIFDQVGQVKKFQEINFSALNDEIEPIWCDVEGVKKKSGLMMWPGGEFSYKDLKATYNQPYNTEIDWQTRADTIVNWITTDCKLVMAYFEDKPCYDIDKYENHVKEHTGNVDNIIEYIYTKLPRDINIVILSDHGVSQVLASNVLMIEQYVTDETIPKIVSGPLVYLKVIGRTNRERLLIILQKHTDKFMAYIISNFPVNWHIKKHSVFDDIIILVANPSFTFMESTQFNKLLSDNEVTAQNFMTLEDGYDNNVSDMNAFFVGIGPGFIDNRFPGNAIPLIDVYPLLKVLLYLPGYICVDQKNISMSEEMKKLVEPDLLNTFATVDDNFDELYNKKYLNKS